MKSGDRAPSAPCVSVAVEHAASNATATLLKERITFEKEDASTLLIIFRNTQALVALHEPMGTNTPREKEKG